MSNPTVSDPETSELGSSLDAELRRKISSARWRLAMGTFGHAVSVGVFAASLVAIIAMVWLAITPIQIQGAPVDPAVWITSWVTGSFGIALVGSLLWTWFRMPNEDAVALDLDGRCGLRQRLSSSLATPSSASPIAAALHADARQHAAGIDVAKHYPLQLKRIAWLPLSVFPILLAMIMTVQPAQIAVVEPETVTATEVKQVQAAATELKKRLAAQRRQAEAKGLKEAEELFAKMQAKLDQITSGKPMTRKDALIQINDIKDQIKQRRDRLGSPDQMRRTMSQLKGLQGGPAEKIAEQIRRGEFGKAAEELKDLAKKLRDGKLSEQQKKQLAEQAETLAKQLKKAAQDHEQKKAQLKQQIEQAKREGRSDEASKLQQQLNQAEAADSQMKQMQQMSQAMEQAAQAMREGNGAEAADAMAEMAGELGQMQDAMSELEDLQDALDDLSQSKQQMNCKQCGGSGCQSCQGSQMGDQFGQGQRGRGPGSGDRGEADDETNTYDSQVRGDVKRGKAIIAGFADGPNRKGITREDIQRVVENTLQDEGDPLEDQVLPRDRRDQTRQYFDQLRDQ
ncbi:MAG: hypothetical protein AAF539_10735 [Planctomycetota bacterium]